MKPVPFQNSIERLCCFSVVMTKDSAESLALRMASRDMLPLHGLRPLADLTVPSTRIDGT